MQVGVTAVTVSLPIHPHPPMHLLYTGSLQGAHRRDATYSLLLVAPCPQVVLMVYVVTGADCDLDRALALSLVEQQVRPQPSTPALLQCAHHPHTRRA